MKTRTVSIVKHPPELVWRTMRDRLPEIARLVEDIESVSASSKETDPAGAVHIVNIWQARPKLPAVVVSHVRADMLAWTDRSVWPAKKFECAWRIEPHFLPSGSTAGASHDMSRRWVGAARESRLTAI